MTVLLTVSSAVAAVVAAYVCNRLSRTRVGRRAIVLVAPGLEESFKTGAALLLGAPVFGVHVAFGGLEAVYDLVTGTGAGRRVGAAAAGLAGHTLFGALTVAAAEASGSWPLGVAAAYFVHVGWNALVMSRARPNRD